MNNDVDLIALKLKYERFGFHSNVKRIKLNNEEINLPLRVYYYELTDHELKQLTNTQQRFVWCYYLCHHNGFIRQKYLQRILESGDILEHEIPYIVSEIGSYVYEIIGEVYQSFDLLIEKGLEMFIENKTSYAKLTWGRLASY